MNIKVYGNCPICKQLKELLRNEQLPFEPLDLDLDVARKYNTTMQPIVLINDELLLKYSAVEYFKHIEKLTKELK
jgi:glutaredoxin